MVRLEALQSDLAAIQSEKEGSERRYHREMTLLGKSFEMQKEEMERQLTEANRQHARSQRCVRRTPISHPCGRTKHDMLRFRRVITIFHHVMEPQI